MKGIKRLVIIGCAVFVTGAVMFVVAMSALKWDFYRLDTTKYEAKTYSYGGETVNEVVVDVDSFPVTVKRGDLGLNYYEADDSTVSVNCENGVLKVYEKHKFSLFKSSWFELGRFKHKYELTVPDGVAVTVKGTNGDIVLGGLNTESVFIKSTNVDLKLSDCRINTLTVDSTNADIELNGCSIGSVTLTSTNIDATVVDCDINTFGLKGTNLDAEIRGGRCVDASLTSTNADIDIANVSIDKLYLKGTNLDADVVINGVKSEYSIVTHGKKLPPQQTGTTDKSVTLSGTNNDVELKWVG